MKYKLALLTIAVLILTSCSKTKTQVNDNVEGTWVSADKLDTIIFNKPSASMLKVKRAPINGIQRSFGEDLYFYKLKTDSISVQLLVSSAYYGDRYHYFKKDGNELTIGSFFALEKSTAVTRFQKISN